MSLERPPSSLPGVRYGAVARMADARGAFRELWRADAFGAIEPGDAGADPATTPTFVQANLSTSAPGVLRGLHYHQRQLDYWVVASGRAFVALVDLRPVLRGTGDQPVVETRELREDEWVVIPAGVAHGFLALEALGMLYLVTNPYDGAMSWASPGTTPSPGSAGPPSNRPPTGARSSPTGTAPTPTLADLVVRLRHGGPGADPDRTTPPGPARDRTGPDGPTGDGTIPRLSASRARARA